MYVDGDRSGVAGGTRSGSEAIEARGPLRLRSSDRSREAASQEIIRHIVPLGVYEPPSVYGLRELFAPSRAWGGAEGPPSAPVP
jgi:hypothetical protein